MGVIFLVLLAAGCGSLCVGPARVGGVRSREVGFAGSRFATVRSAVGDEGETTMTGRLYRTSAAVWLGSAIDASKGRLGGGPTERAFVAASFGVACVAALSLGEADDATTDTAAPVRFVALALAAFGLGHSAFAVRRATALANTVAATACLSGWSLAARRRGVARRQLLGAGELKSALVAAVRVGPAASTFYAVCLVAPALVSAAVAPSAAIALGSSLVAGVGLAQKELAAARSSNESSPKSAAVFRRLNLALAVGATLVANVALKTAQRPIPPRERAVLAALIAAFTLTFSFGYTDASNDGAI